MIKRIMTALIFSCLFVGACSSCRSGGLSYDANWPKTRDADALFAQNLLDKTVLVDVKIIIDVSPLLQFSSSDNDESATIVEKGSGSGTIVSVKFRGNKVESLVLTAHHVCHIPNTVRVSVFPYPLNVVGGDLSITNSAGDIMHAETIFEDETNDLCVLKVHGNAGKVAKIANNMPPVGARIIHAGAPTRTYGRHLGVVVDGRYAGIENIGKQSVVAMALPIEPGSSGGGMYYDGQLFATLNWSSGRGGNMSWGAKLEHINDILNKAHIVWATNR